MMYRILIFLLLTTQIFSSIAIPNGLQGKKLGSWLKANYNITDEEIVGNGKSNGLEFQIMENSNATDSFSKVIYSGRTYVVKPVFAGRMEIEGDVQAYYSSPWKDVPFIVRKGKVLTLLGNNVLENRELMDVLKRYLTENESFFREKTASTPLVQEKKGDITRLVNILIKVFAVGILLFLTLLRRSIKKRFGDPFKGE